MPRNRWQVLSWPVLLQFKMASSTALTSASEDGFIYSTSFLLLHKQIAGALHPWEDSSSEHLVSEVWCGVISRIDEIEIVPSYLIRCHSTSLCLETLDWKEGKCTCNTVQYLGSCMSACWTLVNKSKPLPLWLHLSQQHDTELTRMFMFAISVKRNLVPLQMQQQIFGCSMKHVTPLQHLCLVSCEFAPAAGAATWHYAMVAGERYSDWDWWWRACACWRESRSSSQHDQQEQVSPEEDSIRDNQHEGEDSGLIGEQLPSFCRGQWPTSSAWSAAATQLVRLPHEHEGSDLHGKWCWLADETGTFFQLQLVQVIIGSNLWKTDVQRVWSHWTLELFSDNKRFDPWMPFYWFAKRQADCGDDPWLTVAYGTQAKTAGTCCCLCCWHRRQTIGGLE